MSLDPKEKSHAQVENPGHYFRRRGLDAGFRMGLAGVKLTSHCAEAERKSIFEKAEAYSSVTERLFYRNAISRETYHIRQGYFMACMDENQAYWKELQSGDRDGIRFEKEIFRQACNLGR